MAPSQPSVPTNPVRQRRFGPMFATFAIGVPLAASILWLFNYGPLQDSPARRYIAHPVECVEVLLFSCALGALITKLIAMMAERAAFRANLVSAWNGRTVPLSEAGPLLAELEGRARWARGTYLGKRVGAILDFLHSRGSATELDDQLRTLADNDFVNHEGSFALIRFITWAMPILGFLGTVLGITGAIAGVTPEQLEKSLSSVTDGLALAFDATALALALTMIVMFLTFVVERMEQSVLTSVDQFVDRNLAHRFERSGTAGGEFLETVRQNNQILVQATEQLVKKQAAVWAQALDKVSQHRTEMETDFRQHLSAGLQTALDKSLETHAQRLAALEKQSAAQNAVLMEKLGSLTRLADRLAAQTEALANLQEGETQLIRLQERLQQNLETLADAGAFQQAVHSLTAAIHLLTSHTGTQRRPGAAA